MSARSTLETTAVLLDAGVSRPVFDVRWPEAHAVVAAVWNELAGGHLGRELYEAPYHGAQDGLQDAFLDAWLAWREPVVGIDTTGLPCRYATAGSSEAIREVLAKYAVGRWALNHRPVLHLFDGEYEGYAAVAEGYGAMVQRHDRARWRESVGPWAGTFAHGDLFLLSQPSAIDGNLWPDYDAFLAHIETVLPELRVGVDLSYVGAVARPYRVAVTSPVIDTVFFSLSKIFGVYYHRIGGVLSRLPLSGLVGNRWFKNTASLTIGRRLLGTLPPRAIPSRYAGLQAEAAAAAGAALGVSLAPSDAILVAAQPWDAGLPPAVAALRRGPAIRYCLTPGIDRMLARPSLTAPA